MHKFMSVPSTSFHQNLTNLFSPTGVSALIVAISPPNAATMKMNDAADPPNACLVRFAQRGEPFPPTHFAPFGSHCL
jgi:hypothetical protein